MYLLLVHQGLGIWLQMGDWRLQNTLLCEHIPYVSFTCLQKPIACNLQAGGSDLPSLTTLAKPQDYACTSAVVRLLRGSQL